MRSTSAFIIVVLAACGLTVVSQLYLPIPLLVKIAEQYGVSVSAAGWVLTVFGIAYATGFLVFGPLSDCLGRKMIMVAGLGLLALVSLLVAVAPTFEGMVGARILQGFVAATLPPVALAYLSETLSEETQAFGIACMSTAFMLAGLLGQIYGNALGSLSAAMLPLVGIYATGAVFVGLLPGRWAEGNKDLKSVFDVYAGLPVLLSNKALLKTYAGTLVLLFTHLTHGLEIVASLATLEKLPGQL
jgi:MFS family permease